MVELTSEQQQISDAILDWYRRPTGYLAVAGYAGTGKTTVMGVTASMLSDRLSVAYCAPTGKAVSVLRNKLEGVGALNENSSTLTVHSLLYNCKGRGKANKLIFEKKTNKQVGDWDLIVVDEASMITEPMFRDLKSLGIPLLFIGDPGQLPPIESKAFKPIAETELVLRTIHRQALDNPIIKYANIVREGGEVPIGDFDGRLYHRTKGKRKPILEGNVFPHILTSDAVILSYFNSTRVLMNRNVRKTNNLNSVLPELGERLVALSNNKDYDLMNGEQLIVESITPCVNDSCYFIKLKGKPIEVWAFTDSLNACTGEDISTALRNKDEDISECQETYSWLPESPYCLDFGYAMSVHKSQGSEWKTVVLLEERPERCSDEDYARWLYTGMTRAKEKLLMI